MLTGDHLPSSFAAQGLCAHMQDHQLQWHMIICTDLRECILSLISQMSDICAGVEAQLGSVQQGDSPLQLQSPVPGVTLPQYQPDPSLPATQPASAEASASQHASEPVAGSGSTAAVSVTAAQSMQPDASSSEHLKEPSQRNAAVQEQSSAPQGGPGAEDGRSGQDVSDQELFHRQARACFLRSHVCSHRVVTCMVMRKEMMS